MEFREVYNIFPDKQSDWAQAIYPTQDIAIIANFRVYSHALESKLIFYSFKKFFL
jgi:hypothetical protein